MSWLQRLLPSKIRTDNSVKKGIPEGIWIKCKGCQAVLYREEFEQNLWICPKCIHHGYLSARQRLILFLDENSGTEIASSVVATDYLKFKDIKKYKDRLRVAQENTAEMEALIVMEGQLESLSVVTAAFEFNFMGGSMGAAVGEKFVRGVQRACEKRLPFICFTASGGARMQEALFSLMQMAKTSAVLAKLAEQRLPYIAILTHPTMGGVSASLAMLGDVILAEPKALIGFAGPRVIEQTVRTPLPEGFQRSEFLLAHGAIDAIVDRRELRTVVSRLLKKFIAMA